MALEDAKTQIDTAFTRKSQRGLAFENAFSGATSFLRRTYTKDLTGVDLAITGVPFDQAVTHRPGARFGPRAIRQASHICPVWILTYQDVTSKHQTNAHSIQLLTVAFCFYWTEYNLRYSYKSL